MSVIEWGQRGFQRFFFVSTGVTKACEVRGRGRFSTRSQRVQVFAAYRSDVSLANDTRYRSSRGGFTPLSVGAWGDGM